MGRKHIPGLIMRAGIWHIDKHILRRRVCQITGTTCLEEAEQYLARVMEETRQAQIFGVRPSHSFEEAAAKYVLENQHKRSIGDDVSRLKRLMPWLGCTPLHKIHRGTLQAWVDRKRRSGTAVGTINHGLQIVRRILNLAASEWVDEQGLTWLHGAPKIKLLPDAQKRQPYPLSWDGQTRLFRELPAHLADMALFVVNTGCRDQEICNLRWEWEVEVPELGVSVFVIPGARVKNGEDRLVVLNRIALSVIDRRRGIHPAHVFSFRGHAIGYMLNTGWRAAREKAGLPHVRVHDLKHTFGRRLRAAGVTFEDRQDLLGHRSGKITTHYSAAELSRLIECANRVCDRDGKLPELVILRGTLSGRLPQNSRNDRGTSGAAQLTR